MSVTLLRGRAGSASMLDRPGAVRSLIVLALVAGAAAGWALGARDATLSDPDLTRLLRAMAVLKVAFVAAAAGAILWRLQAPVRPAGLAGYALVCAAMAAGPCLIWFSSHIVLAAILLHAGIAAALLLLWRDPATAELLSAAVIRRRTARRQS